MMVYWCTNTYAVTICCILSPNCHTLVRHPVEQSQHEYRFKKNTGGRRDTATADTTRLPEQYTGSPRCLFTGTVHCAINKHIVGDGVKLFRHTRRKKDGFAGTGVCVGVRSVCLPSGRAREFNGDGGVSAGWDREITD